MVILTSSTVTVAPIPTFPLTSILHTDVGAVVLFGRTLIVYDAPVPKPVIVSSPVADVDVFQTVSVLNLY